MHISSTFRAYFSVFLWFTVFIITFSNPWSFGSLFYILLIVVSIYGLQGDMVRWLSDQWKYVLTQAAFAIGYFLFHLRDILKLELWSDEILSLKISSGPFQNVAREALSIGFFPPYHYWELWIWQYLVRDIPPEYIEFVYRIPSVIAHTTGAIAFSWLLFTLYVKAYPQYFYTGIFIRMAGFAIYFWNPILFPYALEVRPYAIMALGSVLVLSSVVARALHTIRFLPLQFLIFLTSFMHMVLYLPTGFFELISGKRRTYVFITIALIANIVLVFLPYIGQPHTTSFQISIFEIKRAHQVIFNIFSPNILFAVLLLFSTVCAISIRKFRPLILEALFLYGVITVLAYTIRYQAFAPRHYILLVPYLLLIMVSPLFVKRRSMHLIGLMTLSVFVVQWATVSEYMLHDRAFAPKIHIGIKVAMQKARMQHLPIGIEQNMFSPSVEAYYTYEYFREVAEWYLDRYHLQIVQKLPPEKLCDAILKREVYAIVYTLQPCFLGKSNVSILTMDIRELR